MHYVHFKTNTAIVEFSSEALAKEAVEKMDQYLYKGRKIMVKADSGTVQKKKKEEKKKEEKYLGPKTWNYPRKGGRGGKRGGGSGGSSAAEMLVARRATRAYFY